MTASATRRYPETRQRELRLGSRNCVTFGLLLLASLTQSVLAVETVHSELDKDTAWLGEPVSLAITLYSPGPFSGTASFDLPELSQTTILPTGSPVVGSEQVDGETFFTQRHEFRVYTQRSGKVTIPAFSARFKGKRSFVGEPEAMDGRTAELSYESRRPPGMDDSGLVIVTSDFDAEQLWVPADSSDLSAGDVVQRQITRQVSGATGMMLPPVDSSAPDGVRIYRTDPSVVDKSARGEHSATRTEILKYQFERAGSFELPTVTFTWWDPTAEKVDSIALEGRTIHVSAGELTAGQASEDAETPPARIGLFATIGGLLVLLVMVLFGKPIREGVAEWQAARRTPESVAAREVFAACKADDARAAYGAALAWKRAAAPIVDAQFELVLRELEQKLFAGRATTGPWSGERLEAAVVAARRSLARPGGRQSLAPLPELNP